MKRFLIPLHIAQAAIVPAVVFRLPKEKFWRMFVAAV